MKIEPTWKDCVACNGTGKIEVKIPPKNPAGGEEGTESIECSACNGAGRIRTDSLHRNMKLRDGNALYDLSILTVDPVLADVCCFHHPDKTCGALCAAFDVRTNEKGDVHYACCAGMPKHIIGVLDVT